MTAPCQKSEKIWAKYINMRKSAERGAAGREEVKNTRYFFAQKEKNRCGKMTPMVQLEGTRVLQRAEQIRSEGVACQCDGLAGKGERRKVARWIGVLIMSEEKLPPEKR